MSISLHVGVPFDLLGEYEPHDTVYTLTAFTPPRPPPSWLPKFATREATSYTNFLLERKSRFEPVPANKPENAFGYEDLKDMKSKQIKIKSSRFPPELRCQHVKEECRSCSEGCYVLEKGGEKSAWRCSRDDCEGHVYMGLVKKEDRGRICFGKKGARMVAIDC